MELINTVRVDRDWLLKAVDEAGTLESFAQKLGVTRSTISRQLNHAVEASPRFIGAILANYPIAFQDAFNVTQEPAVVRRARMVKHLAS